MLKVSNLTKTYNKGKTNELLVLDGVSLTVKKGETVAVMGRSGSGKSTLMNIIGGIDTADSGTVVIDGIDISGMRDGRLSKFRNKNVGFVLQDFALIDEKSVLENVMIPLYFDRYSYKEIKKMSLEVLDKVGISDLAKQSVATLSGGQKQRTAIARAIVNNPRLILADEPTGSLDSETGNHILSLFNELSKNDVTILMVTHDKHVAAICERTVQITDGKINS